MAKAVQEHPMAQGRSKKSLSRWTIGAATLAALMTAMATSAWGQETSPVTGEKIPAARAAQTPAADAQRASSARRIVVSLALRRLALLEGDRVVKVYDVAIGAAATPSPEGEFTIVNRLTDPGWYAPGKVIAPGPENPLGTRWLGLSLKSFGIHGTNEPGSVGKAASTGCIRLRNSDVEQLFRRVRAGDVVVIRGGHDAEMALIFSTAASERAAAPPANNPAAAIVSAAD
jgi:lipoprotein-anchoring transpeptidase ErfK/SrfK